MNEFQNALEIWGATFCLFAAFTGVLSRRTGHRDTRWQVGMEFSAAGLLFSDVAAVRSDGAAGARARAAVVSTDFLVYVLGYVVLFFASEYLAYLIEEYTGESVMRKRKLAGSGRKVRMQPAWLTTIHILTLIGIVLSVLNLFYGFFYTIDSANVYHRAVLFPLSQAIGIAGMLIYLYETLKNIRSFPRIMIAALLSYILLPTAALVIQITVYGYPILNLSIAAAVLLMFVMAHIEQSNRLLAQEKEISAQKQAISDMQVRIVLSQIQPHFIYNSLNAVNYLIEKDPEAARHAVTDFSDYLRGNLEALKKDTPVPFSEELRQVRLYVGLEKLRYGESLQFETDARFDNFMLPPITLQPLVENAVKHGIGKKPEGGMIRITTFLDDDGMVRVRIDDDGVGFDTEKMEKEAEETRSGIVNVRERLMRMCHATLRIMSTPGRGTRAEIVLDPGAVRADVRSSGSGSARSSGRS